MMKRAKLLSCAVAVALSMSMGITSDAYAEKYDPAVAITATALPEEKPATAIPEEKPARAMIEEKTATAMTEEKNEQAVLCTCDYMKCVCGITEQFETTYQFESTDQEVVEQKTTMKDRVAAIMKDETVKTDEVQYAANGVKKGNLYIPKDTVITLRLVDPLHSKKVKKDTMFRLETVDDLVINGVVVIPKGREVLGKVLEARGSRALGGSGKLEINIPSLETLNGVEIPVDGYVSYKGRSDGGAAVVFAVVSMAGGLFMKGKNVEYVEGQLFNVTVNKDTDLEATPDTLAEVMSVDRTRINSITVAVAE